MLYMKGNYKCLYCGKENPNRRNYANKYCNNKCQANHRWETIDRVRVIEGGGATGTIMRYLIEENNSCAECGQMNIHNNKPLTLQLDHIDGNSDNNDLSNVRLLCPNCHTQTDTYGAKGYGNTRKKTHKRNKYIQEYRSVAQR